MRRQRVGLVATLLSAALFGAASGLEAQRIQFSETAWAEFSLLLDLRAEALKPGDDALDSDTDYFVNLARLALRGQVAPGLGFLVATGSDRNFENPEIWDAVAFMEIDPAFTVEVGRVLLPFVRYSQQFNNELQTPDLARTAFMYPRGSTLRRRDEGVRVRGLLLNDRIDYRVAVTGGVETEDNIPRLTGRVGVNFGRPEKGYVFPGTYLGGPAVVTAGLAFDVQPDVVEGGGTYHGLGADLFWSVPVSEHRVTGQASLVRYHGLNGMVDGEPVVLDRNGVGGVFDLSYLLGRIGPVVAFEWFRPQGSTDFDDQLFAAQVGLNYWLRGTAANVKLQGGLRKERFTAMDDADGVVTLQIQTRLPLPGQPTPSTGKTAP